jgi:hypothetical protein
MSSQEIVRLINRYIGVEGGHLGDFTVRTLAEFYPEFCDLDVDAKQYEGTKRERFETILRAAGPAAQAKIVRGILKKYPPQPGVGPRTQEMHDEFVRIAQRLEGVAGVVTPTLEQTSEVVERALADAETLIRTTGATSGVDRLHTALHGYLRVVCDSQGIPYTEETPILALFTLVRERHPAFSRPIPRAQDVTKVCRSMGAAMDALLPIRNRASVAHPNAELLEAPEAMLVINAARTILHYVNDKLAQHQDLPGHSGA